MSPPRHPRIPHRLSDLSASQRAALETSSGQAGADPGQRNRIKRAAGSGPTPLSYAQSGIWLINQVNRASAAYNMPAAHHIRGPLHVPAIRASVTALSRRHHVLRSVFPVINGEPAQIASEAVELEVTDLTHLPADQRYAEAVKLAEADAQRPFSLQAEPPLRARLLRLAADDHLFLLNVHHIAADEWSFKIIYEELGQLYAHFATDAPCTLAEPEIQYADYARWERAELAGHRLSKEVAYWTGQLAGACYQLQLPGACPPHARNDPPAHSDGMQHFTVPPSVLPRLAAIAQEAGATLFVVLAAALAALLQRYCRQDDILIATPAASRADPEVEHAVGLFLNTLILRIDVSGNPTFTELVRRVQRVTLAAIEHSRLPFDHLIRELQPERQVTGNTLFQVLLNLRHDGEDKLTLPGLATEHLPGIDSHAAKFDLRAEFIESGAALRGNMVYGADVLRPAAAHRLTSHLIELLTAVTARPDLPLSSHPITVHAAVPRGGPLAVCEYWPITDAIVRHAEGAPQHIAIKGPQSQLTYADLVARARALAGMLPPAAAGQPTVAVHGRTSTGTATAMVSVLLSGAILVPVDSQLPAHRKEQMLTAAGVTHLLHVGTSRDLDDCMRADVPWTVIQVTTDTGHFIAEDVGHQPVPGPAPTPGPDAPAYVMFTSGTTGAPQGIAGSHRALGHFLGWQREQFSISSDDRCPLLTSISFDVSLRELLLPLVSGGTVCVPSEADQFEPTRLLSWLRAEGITVLHAVPTTAGFWLAHAPTDAALPQLRMVFFAGEPLTGLLAERWRSRLSRTAGIVNLYGPTETTLAKCFYQVPENCFPGVQPVGTPLPGTEVLVLDREGLPCQPGVTGELVIRPPFHPLGYIGEPIRSGFFDSPFGGRALRTGDAGRYRPDGLLEVCGRIDQQVKIRGVRVEPEGVRAVLASHPGVRACAVVTRPDADGNAELVAYVVSTCEEKEEEVTAAQLRAFLAHRLPGGMIPQHLVFTDELPRTLNGKVDERALPPPTAWSPPPPGPLPPTPTERVVASLWEKVLGAETVQPHDNFFDCGGHSLLGMTLLAQIHQRFNVKLTLKNLFEAQTVTALSKLIDRSPRTEAAAEPPLRRVSREKYQTG